MSAYALATWATVALAMGEPGDSAEPSRDPVRALLDLPAPPPPWTGIVKPPRPQAAPADDAPIDQLLRYWSERKQEESIRPSEKTSNRLLEGCLREPQYLPYLVRFLPNTPEAAEQVKRLYDEQGRLGNMSAQGKNAVHNWLMTHSKHFRDELIRVARGAVFKYFALEGKAELVALARLDWAQAEPILKEFAADTELRRAAEAKSMLFHHAVATRDTRRASVLREELQVVVVDRKAPPHVRALSCEGLMGGDWPGRDEWYLSLFADDTLREMVEDSLVRRPLCDPVQRDPDKWIPLIAKLVGNKDRAVHDNAVSCLIGFHLEKARKDALKPLLPWLSDPEWSSARDRLRLIQSLDRVDLPESVPGLIRVVEREDRFELQAAAEALAVYHDRRAVAALKEALERPNDEFHRRPVVEALLVCDGLSDHEIVGAVEAYAVQVSTSAGLQEVSDVIRSLTKKRLSSRVSLGYHLCSLKPSRERAATQLLARSDVLDKEKPQAAREMRYTVLSWPGKAIDSYILRRIGEGKADAVTLQRSLERRNSLRANVAGELRTLGDKTGAVRGWAAVLSGDVRQEAAVLDGTDQQAQLALLAGARLIREPLPVAKVGRLLKKTVGEVPLAAERYLESEDSPAARQFVYDHHPGEALILGARQEFDPGHNTYEVFDTWEKRLRHEILGKDGPEEVYALLSAGYWGNAGQRVVRIRGDKAEFAIHGGKKPPEVRALAPAELAQLRSCVAENKIDDLPPFTPIAYDGLQYEYLHLTKKGGRRVFMNNPGDPPYGLLTAHFASLGRKASAPR
jgi:hypothetical protein